MLSDGHDRHAVILGVTADIGIHLAERLLKQGWRVTGLGRDAARAASLDSHEHFRFVPCDLSSTKSMQSAIATVSESTPAWTLFVSSAGTMKPIGSFFDLDFDDWEASIHVNATAQLRILHGLWPHRTRDHTAQVCLLAGGGTNGPMPNYSAYCLSKIALIKMVELMDDEAEDGNFFIIGPGFMHTRIHEETLEAGDAAGLGLSKTLSFMETAGTTHDELYDCIDWCVSSGRAVAGGRNFSTVHDPWRNGGENLAKVLTGNTNAHRLRRTPSE